jgi:hypothetical protein
VVHPRKALLAQTSVQHGAHCGSHRSSAHPQCPGSSATVARPRPWSASAAVNAGRQQGARSAWTKRLPWFQRHASRDVFLERQRRTRDHFFSCASAKASLRISTSMVFLPNRRSISRIRFFR